MQTPTTKVFEHNIDDYGLVSFYLGVVCALFKEGQLKMPIFLHLAVVIIDHGLFDE